MKAIIELIDKHVREKGYDLNRGMDCLCDYLIDMFDVRHYIAQDFKRSLEKKQEESPELFQVAIIWASKVADAKKNGMFFDMFGHIYEELYKSKSKAKEMGQFYTPDNVAMLLAKLTHTRELENNQFMICDPGGCGSGRTLLAAHAANGYDDGYYQGEDLDISSVKMCALNMMIHGMRGRVVQHDTLIHPYIYDFGFEVNEVRYPFPTSLFSLRKISFTKDDMMKRNERVRKRYGENVTVSQYNGYEIVRPKDGAKPAPLFKPKEKVQFIIKEPEQLSLFDEW